MLIKHISKNTLLYPRLIARNSMCFASNIILELVNTCTSDILEPYIGDILPIILKNREFSYSTCMNNSLISDSIIIFEDSIKNVDRIFDRIAFVKNALKYCSKDVLIQHIDRVLGYLNLDFNILKIDSPHINLIADYVIENNSKYPNLVPIVLEFCSRDILKDNLLDVLEIVNNSHTRFNLPSLDSDLLTEIADIVITSSEEYTKLVPIFISYCSLDKLEAYLTDILENFDIALNIAVLDTPGGRFIADYIISK